MFVLDLSRVTFHKLRSIPSLPHSSRFFTIKAHLILLYALSVSIKMMMWSVFMSINMMDQPYRFVELTLHCWDETTWAMAYSVLILIFDSDYILLKIFYLWSPERFICILRYVFIQFLYQLQCFHKMSLVVCFFPHTLFFCRTVWKMLMWVLPWYYGRI